MAEYHRFDEEAIHTAMEAAQRHFELDRRAARDLGLTAHGHLSLAAACIAVKVENNQICLSLPLGIGNICLPIPVTIPDGTVAEACLHICTFGPIPTGVKVTVSVAGKIILTKSFGKC